MLAISWNPIVDGWTGGLIKRRVNRRPNQTMSDTPVPIHIRISMMPQSIRCFPCDNVVTMLLSLLMKGTWMAVQSYPALPRRFVAWRFALVSHICGIPWFKPNCLQNMVRKMPLYYIKTYEWCPWSPYILVDKVIRRQQSKDARITWLPYHLK